MKLTVYIETSVISAYFDSRAPERQGQTQNFWQVLKKYEIFTSQLVIDELSRIKDEILKKQVLDLIKEIEIIQDPQKTKDLAQIYMNKGIFPKKDLVDAYHLDVATLSGCHILVS
ncbi:MAG: PIN domain-containing protein [Promethearchaeota archaeon]